MTDEEEYRHFLARFGATYVAVDEAVWLRPIGEWLATVVLEQLQQLAEDRARLEHDPIEPAA